MSKFVRNRHIVFSPPVFSRYRLMLCFCHLFHLFNDCLEQRDLGNYKTDLHLIFRDGRHVVVDVHSGIDFPIGQGTLPWQPILCAKSAEIVDTPSLILGTRIPQRMAVWKSGWAR